MNTIPRMLVCAAVLALAGCGNKGPLVQADSPQAQDSDTSQPAATGAETSPAETTPADTAPATTVPPTAEPVEPAVPPTDGGDDNGDG